MTANTYGPVWLARYSLDWLMGCRLLTLIACTSPRAWRCKSRQPNNNGMMHGHSLARGGLAG